MIREILIEKNIFGGKGMGHIDEKICFVSNVLAGERVSVRVEREKKNYYEATLIDVIEPSRERVNPECPYYRYCGGCQYQEFTYDEELRVKTLQVEEAFSKHLGVKREQISPMARGVSPWRYRNSMTLHKVKTKATASSARLGLIGRDNKTAIPVDDCLLADRRLSGIFQAKHTLSADGKEVLFQLDADGEIMRSGDGKYFQIKVGEKYFRQTSHGFFQNNLAMASILFDGARSLFEKTGSETLYDLYAGVGTFGIVCSPWVKKVVCIEENPTSAALLDTNWRELAPGITPVVKIGKTEVIFPDCVSTPEGGEGVVLLDPPRSGIHESLAYFLSQWRGCRGIIYVSCDLAKLMRDLRIILAKGLYEVKTVLPFDMFPRTRHIETLVSLEKKMTKNNGDR